MALLDFVHAMTIQSVNNTLGHWNMLTRDQQLALLRQLQGMSPASRGHVESQCWPMRDQMASLAASHGMDASFLYEYVSGTASAR